METCIFCKISNREIASNILHETEELFVIPDLHPRAPIHLLIISKEHINSAHHLEEKHEVLVGRMIFAAQKIADEQGIGVRGYKLVFNVGKEGGQTIPHLHLHLLGGKQLSE